MALYLVFVVWLHHAYIYSAGQSTHSMDFNKLIFLQFYFHYLYIHLFSFSSFTPFHRFWLSSPILKFYFLSRLPCHLKWTWTVVCLPSCRLIRVLPKDFEQLSFLSIYSIIFKVMIKINIRNCKWADLIIKLSDNLQALWIHILKTWSSLVLHDSHLIFWNWQMTYFLLQNILFPQDELLTMGLF